jgi:hypothetical protein
VASNSAKRVVAYRFERQPLEGFVHPSTFLLASGVELLTLSGAVQAISFADLKAVCFAGEPARFDLFEVHPLFERRPRFPGLWTRFTLKDGARIDGILPHNLAEWPAAGFLFTPPRASGARQRVFIPREALMKSEFQGLIGAGGPKLRQPKLFEDQLQMFE